MQSIFGSGFGAPQNQNLVQFRAGKCQLTPRPNGKFLISADLRKGQVTITRGPDGLVRFKWSNFTTGVVEDEPIVMPGESIFKKVKSPRPEDRVYILKFHQGDRRIMIWMQEKDSSKDEELVRKINDSLNGNSTSGIPQPFPRPGPSGNNMGLDLSALLSGLQRPAPSSAPPASSSSGPSSGLTVQALQRAMQNMPANPTGSTTSNLPAPPLQDILTAEEINRSGILNDNAIQQQLISNMPLEQQSADQLDSTLRSPQFQQALGTLSQALRDPSNFQGITSNFQLNPASGTNQLMRGDGVGAFLSAVQATHPPTNNNQESKEEEKKEEEKKEDRMEE